jgi:hypothetical protein
MNDKTLEQIINCLTVTVNQKQKIIEDKDIEITKLKRKIYSLETIAKANKSNKVVAITTSKEPKLPKL